MGTLKKQFTFLIMVSFSASVNSGHLCKRFFYSVMLKNRSCDSRVAIPDKYLSFLSDYLAYLSYISQECIEIDETRESSF